MRVVRDIQLTPFQRHSIAGLFAQTNPLRGRLQQVREQRAKLEAQAKDLEHEIEQAEQQWTRLVLLEHGVDLPEQYPRDLTSNVSADRSHMTLTGPAALQDVIYPREKSQETPPAMGPSTKESNPPAPDRAAWGRPSAEATRSPAGEAGRGLSGKGRLAACEWSRIDAERNEVGGAMDDLGELEKRAQADRDEQVLAVIARLREAEGLLRELVEGGWLLRLRRPVYPARAQPAPLRARAARAFLGQPS